MLGFRPRPLHCLPLLAAILAIGVLPSVAAAHERGLGDGDVPRDPEAAVVLRAYQEEALAALPVETFAGTCARTMEVDGLGNACRTRSGLFRVELDSGTSISTHGGDAPYATGSRTAEAAHLPDSAAALSGASAADVECVTGPSDRRIELVYAYPANRPNRAATVTGPMRQSIYEASAFVDAESRAVDPDSGRRLRVLCSGGVPVVHAVQLGAMAGGGTSFDDVVAGLVGQGYPQPVWNSPSARRFVVFYDGPNSNGAAGVGEIWYDEQPGAANLNNRGGRYAVEFDWGSSHLPHWDVLLHEASHNMGAISDNAPDASGNGHCNDGLDIMCYADGGATSAYTASSCPVERYDCGADSYFNPAPAPGTYLANHWNIGSVNNSWLQPRFTGWNDGGVPDLTAPPAVTGLAIATPAFTSLTANWTASVDDRSAVRYRVLLDRNVNGAWQAEATLGPLSATTVTATDLASGTGYRFRVQAFDQAGNTSGEAIVAGSTSSGPPEPPSTIDTAVTSSSELAASWPAGTAGSAIRGYEVGLSRGGGGWSTLGEVAGLSVRLMQLDPGSAYRVRVRTVLQTGVASAWRTGLEVRLPGGTLAGADDEDAEGAPASPVVRALPSGATSVTATWTSTPGASLWDVDLLDAAGTRVQGIAKGEDTSFTFTGLRPDTAYTIRVVAFASVAGAASQPGIATFRSGRDRTPPGVVKLVGTAKVAGANAKVTWKAATDDVAVARYEVERKVGAKWVKAGKAAASARTLTIKGLRARSVTQLRIRAVDTAGLGGRWTAFNVRRR